MELTKIILVCHCLLNQSTRAGGDITPGVEKKILQLLSHYPFPVEQLPCPEYLFAGHREKKDKDEWERVEGFPEFCGQLAHRVGSFLKKLSVSSSLLLISIARSPCCSFSEIYVAGELIPGRGIFLKELRQRIHFEVVEFDFKRVDESLKRLRSKITQ